MRLIDVDALIKQMEADAEQMEDPIAAMFTYAAINDVKHAPTIEPEPKWIPCQERLPIDARHYLCSFNSPNRIDKIYVDLAYWTGGRWYGYRQDQINAWMPLPSPYQREGDPK